MFQLKYLSHFTALSSDFMGNQILLTLLFKEMLVTSQSDFSQLFAKGADFFDFLVKKPFEHLFFCVAQ